MQTGAGWYEHLGHPDWDNLKRRGQSKGARKKNKVKELNQGLAWDKDSLQEMGQQKWGETLPTKTHLFANTEEKATNVCELWPELWDLSYKWDTQRNDGGGAEYQGCALCTPSNLKPLICCVVPSSSLGIWDNGLEGENRSPWYQMINWTSNHLPNEACD